jgi:hypothetical protein
MAKEQGHPGAARKPEHNAVGLPEPEREELVARHSHPDRPVGERQDGAGAAPRKHDRADHVPAGSTAERRSGPTDPTDAGAHGPSGEEPDAEHRGRPATFRSGAAEGSGAGAGGGGAGLTEEPGVDSAGGGGRGPNYAAQRPSTAGRR